MKSDHHDDAPGDAIQSVLPALSILEFVAAASHGITTIHDAGVGFIARAADVLAYQWAAQQGRLRGGS
jgi:predicted amidohydrolase YtcJ